MVSFRAQVFDHRGIEERIKMGIQGLAKLIGDLAPASTKENEIKNYFGRKIAIDASMCIYQFLIAVRSDGNQLTNEAGETTSHLLGLFYRTIRMVENGIKPVYVFDGKPPHLKSGELAKRSERREEAQKALTKAEETVRMKCLSGSQVKGTGLTDSRSHSMFHSKAVCLSGKKQGKLKSYYPVVKTPREMIGYGKARTLHGKTHLKSLQCMEGVSKGDVESMEKFSRRLVKVTPEHNRDCQKLLSLMGIPHVNAPCEAEAQCASLVKAGKVYATGTEDMDALTFGCGVLLRHLTFSEARKTPIREFYLDRILNEIGLTQDEFIDLCILLGCDYCGSIKGVGPKRAIDLIRQYRSIEEIIKHLDTSKHPIPEGWQFKEARDLFKNPDVASADTVELKWEEPNVEELVKYMVEEKGFSEDRIRSGIKKLSKARQGSTQGRLDSFFKVLPSPTNKRKTEDTKGGQKKKPKSSSGGKFKKPR